MFRFRLDGSSGVPPYLQLVHQVRQSLLLGYLRPDDRLPTVKEVAVAGRPGQGTFITASPMPSTEQPVPSAATQELRRSLDVWLRDAAAAGLSEEAITALIAAARRDAAAVSAGTAGAGAVAKERVE
jgi:GntR family transcriptional regulator